MTELARLLEPGRIGKLELKNRVVYPPMGTRLFTEQGEVSDRLIAYYAERARGGVGLIVFESTYPRAGGYRGRVCLDDDRFIPQLKRLTDAIHAEGAKVVCQVNVHRGRTDEHDSASASAVPHPYTGKVPRMVSIAELKRLEEEFGQGVRRVKEAGFDGVMVHGANGYLISEFMSPITNKRTDEYGATLEGRARFALELVQVSRQNIGPDYPIIFRLMADDRLEGGFGLKDAIAVSRMLEQSGVDAIDVTTGFLDTDEWIAPTMSMPVAGNTHHSEAIKKEVGIPVMVAGRINDPYLAEQVLREGKADFADMGRAFLADPQILKKAIEGRAGDMRKCIGCSRCSESIVETRNPLQCSVNPAVGKEREFASGLIPAAKKKRVLVIGGGMAGMQAAVLSAQRGHHVTLWEAGDKLGGEINLAVLPPGKGDLHYLLDYLAAQIRREGVAVEFGKKASRNAVEEFAPETVVIAVGAIPVTPDIPGIGLEKVVGYKQVLTGEKQIGQKVVVIGGGLIGCETADFLAEKGKAVTVAFFEPAPLIVFRRLRRFMLIELQKRKVNIMSEVKEFRKITQQGIELVDKEGKEVFLEADNIVLATGSRPDKTLAESLQGKVPEIYLAGDCAEPRRIMEAVHEGAEAGLKI